MHTPSILWGFLILGLAFLTGGFEEKFVGRISYDDILYGSIDIPDATHSLSLLLWTQETVNPIYAIIGIGRVPTIDDYDNIIELPPLPQTLQLTQTLPPAGKVFIGFWGGKLLHSYRYFAGQKLFSSVGMQYVTSAISMPSTSSSFISVISQQQQNIIQKEDSLTINRASSFSIFIPPETSSITIDTNISISLEQYQSNEMSEKLLLTLQASFDSNTAASASVQHHATYFTSAQYIHKDHLCNLQNTAMSLSWKFPLPGHWQVVMSLLENISPAASLIRKPNIQTTNSVQHKLHRWSPHFQVAHNSTSSRFLSPVCSDSLTNIDNSTTKDVTMFRSKLRWQLSPYSTSLASSNYVSLIRMNTIYWTNVRQEYVGASSRLFSHTGSILNGNSVNNENIPVTSSSLIYTTTVPTSPGFVFANIFAGVILQLYLRVNSHDDEVLSVLQSLPWQVALRVGNLPYWKVNDTTNASPTGIDSGTDINNGSSSSTAVRGGSWVADAVFRSDMLDDDYHNDQPRPQVRHVERSFYVSKTNPALHVLRFDWHWSTPYLHHFHSRNDLLDASRRLFFRVSVAGLEESGHLSETQIALEGLLARGITIDAQFKLVADPCAALGPSPCAHQGHCQVTTTGTVEEASSSSDDDDNSSGFGDAVVTAQCKCRYPWAGAQCHSLAVSSWTYTWQVLVLVLSNAAMVPAVWLSVHHRLYLLTTGLCASSLSSAVYHLCDLEVYCLAGLSFASLHVLDVLFSVAMIATVVFLLAPISRETHAAYTMVCVSLLVAPVIDDPTNAILLIATVTLAVLFTVVQWALLLRKTQRPHLAASSSSPSPLSSASQQQQRSVATTVFGNGPVYSTLLSDEHSDHNSIGNNSGGVRDIEMRSNILSAHTESNFSASSDANSSNNSIDQNTKSKSHEEVSLKAMVGQCRDVVIGVALGVVGLSSYALDDRENYWYVHSVWHVLMMAAAFFLIRGRMHIFHHFGLEGI